MTPFARARDAVRETSSVRAALVSFATSPAQAADADLHLDELAGLARAAGASVGAQIAQTRPAADAATLIGKGKAEQLGGACAEADAGLIIFDQELSPAQARNLERLTGRRVIDRTQLILDIFAQRARTREGKLQVELAQLQYLLPRLVGASPELSRLGGGIGTRGPGETKLETDRRRIRYRLGALRRQLAEQGRRRGYVRERRRRRDIPTVALVGYTNAGKTTLFNRMSGGDAAASDALFVTLDPLLRRVRLPDARTMLVSDTVGFIDRLPHQLVAAFRATLEEVTDADLLLHVADPTMADRDRREAAVRSVLEEVGAASVPTLPVFTKCDRLDADELERLKARCPGAAFVSGRTGDGVAALLDLVAARLAMDVARVHLAFDGGRERDRQQIAELYRHARVISHVTTDAGVSIEADVPRRLLGRFAAAQVPV